MRIFENLIFVFVQIVLIVFLFLMNIRILRNIGKSKFIGITQLLLVNAFSLFTLYETYLELQSAIVKIDLSDTWNQIIIAIMLVCGLVYSVFLSRNTVMQLIDNEQGGLTATLLANGFVVIVLMAITFNVEWNLKWIL